MRRFFNRFRRRPSNPDAEARARARFEHGFALHQDFLQAPAAYKIPRLLEAIQCYHDALSIFTERDFLVDWAMTQNNLGIAYQSLPAGDRGENLRQAIACYQAALRVWTAETLPFSCFDTLHNLSLLYYQQRMSHLEAVSARFTIDDLKREIARSAATHNGKPFAHLYWWAAFQCVGAGWQPLQQ